MSASETSSRWQAWRIAIRPKTLPAAVAPVLVGTALAYADGRFAPLPALAALIVALLLQIGANLANDYYDYVKGVDRAGRQGPLRVAQSGLIPLPHLRRGMWITFALAAAAGSFLIAVGGWPLLILGAAAIAAAVAYSGGPYPFGSYGLGDLFVFLFFGLVAVGGTYYVQTLRLTATALLAATSMGLLATAILVVNNLRDLETDGRAGKRTLAVLMGARLTRLEYTLLLVIAYAILLLLRPAGRRSVWLLLPWLSLPNALRLIRALRRSPDGPAMNRLLAGTAQLELLFGLLLSIGLVLARITGDYP